MFVPSLTKKQYNTLSGSVTFPCTPAADRSQKRLLDICTQLTGDREAYERYGLDVEE